VLRRPQREPQERRAALHRRAASSLERDGMAEAAVRHWFAAEEPGEAARLVAQLNPLRALARARPLGVLRP
jgi:ATP/maltotriose-dependent transcriptional regulator MalT